MGLDALALGPVLHRVVSGESMERKCPSEKIHRIVKAFLRACVQTEGGISDQPMHAYASFPGFTLSATGRMNKRVSGRMIRGRLTPNESCERRCPPTSGHKLKEAIVLRISFICSSSVFVMWSSISAETLDWYHMPSVDSCCSSPSCCAKPGYTGRARTGSSEMPR